MMWSGTFLPRERKATGQGNVASSMAGAGLCVIAGWGSIMVREVEAKHAAGSSRNLSRRGFKCASVP
eukprot:2117539-Alexandrium_andersonii.AAC.1